MSLGLLKAVLLEHGVCCLAWHGMAQRVTVASGGVRDEMEVKSTCYQPTLVLNLW